MQRIDNKLLDKHIHNTLNYNKIYSIITYSQVKKSYYKPANETHVDIYINFVKNRINYAHISLHLTGMEFKTQQHGPFHLFINEFNPSGESYIKLIKASNKDEFAFEYDDINTIYGSESKYKLKEHPEFNIVLDVLNKYLSNKDPLSLGNDISKLTNKPHKYYNIIAKRYELFFPPEQCSGIIGKKSRKAIKYRQRPINNAFKYTRKISRTVQNMNKNMTFTYKNKMRGYKKLPYNKTMNTKVNNYSYTHIKNIPHSNTNGW